MQIFTMTKDDELEFQNFQDRMDKVIHVLEPYTEDIDISEMQSLKRNFNMKIEDFYRNDRKLNIGIIGRVKAGKSSFLNTFLFDGKDILPKAVTPKTAALTRIEYSSENSIEVEYYTDDEWSAIKEKATHNDNRAESIVAKEIIEMIEERDINPYEYTKRGVESIKFESYDKLVLELNNYVGENGTYTPLVKAVTLYVDIEELREISIVDTPGLSDPITSRTTKTKQFMEVCDVVFFMSKATGFLDTNDIDLLMSQLPNKGAKKMVLVCSRFDDGLRDTIWTCKSLSEAIENCQRKLSVHSKRTFDAYRKNHFNAKMSVLEQFKDIVFISAMAYNMSKKDKADYSDEEKKVFNDLNAYGDLTTEKLAEIGNIQAIKKIFDDISEEKDRYLKIKASSFVPTAIDELNTKLEHYERMLETRVNRLKSDDREKILLKKKKLSSSINRVNASIESIFGDLYVKIEREKSNVLRQLRNDKRIYSHLIEKEGLETHFETCKKSTSKWYVPWSWGSSTREVFTYDEKYTYIDASDAPENIRNFASDASDSIENIFTNVIDIVALKRNLYTTIVENFDTTDENYEPAYFKLLVEQTLNTIEMPIINIDVSAVIENFSNKYKGEIRKPDEKGFLKNALADVINELFEHISMRFAEEVSVFKQKLDEIKKQFTDKLLKNFTNEFNIVLEKFSDKESEIEIYKELIEKIRKLE